MELLFIQLIESDVLDLLHLLFQACIYPSILHSSSTAGLCEVQRYSDTYDRKRWDPINPQVVGEGRQQSSRDKFGELWDNRGATPV